MKLFFTVYLVLVFLMSLITFATYGLDKRQAKNGDRRVPEKNLHLLAMLCGWPGALWGRQYFRHKTQKVWFTVMTWFIVSIHVALLISVTYFLWPKS